MEPKCSLQYSQQPTNGNYTDITLQFSPTPVNYDYSLFLAYPQSSHKGERYKPWNDSLFKTDSRKYKFYRIIFTMLFTTTDSPTFLHLNIYLQHIRLFQWLNIQVEGTSLYVFLCVNFAKKNYISIKH